MMELAPTRAGTFGLLFADDTESETYRAVSAWLEAEQARRLLVKLAGGAPLEFNLFHMRANTEGVLRFADAMDIDANALGHAWLTGGN